MNSLVNNTFAKKSNMNIGSRARANQNARKQLFDTRIDLEELITNEMDDSNAMYFYSVNYSTPFNKIQIVVHQWIKNKCPPPPKKNCIVLFYIKKILNFAKNIEQSKTYKHVFISSM